MTPEEYPGHTCWCGLDGCIETWLSGPGFERDYQKHSGLNRKAPEIVKAAQEGDAHAQAALSRYENRLARALAQIINILDPEVIVLGGGMSNVESLYENVPKLWEQWIFSDRLDTTRLVAPMHGDSSGVRGAAWLWNE